MVERIKAVDRETRLLVVDPETHESLRSLRLTATEDMAVPGTEQHSSPPPPAASPSSIPSPPSKKQENGSVSKLPIVASSQVPKPTRRPPSKAAKKVSWPTGYGCQGNCVKLINQLDSGPITEPCGALLLLPSVMQ